MRATTLYHYDDNDRLTGSETTTSALTMDAQNKIDAYYASRPRKSSVYAVGVFAALTLTAFWVPALLPGRRRLGLLSRWVPWPSAAPPCGSREGIRARRRRLRTACIASFLVPLMAVNPTTVDAVTTDALRFHAALTAGLPTNCAPEAVCVTYTYDRNGNQIGRTTVNPDGPEPLVEESFHFDAQNRLVGFTKTNGDNFAGSAAYGYDADGIRRAKAVDGVAVLHTTDKNRPYAQVLEERDAATGDLAVAYTYGDDLISQTRPDPVDPINNPPVTRYYYYDGQMSTRQLSSASGAFEVTDRYAYDAFGVTLDARVATPNAYRYRGEQYEEASEQYYLRARYYSASIGRFATQDPLLGSPRDPRSLHQYLYAHADPANRMDPTGLFTLMELQVNLATTLNNISAALRAYRGIQRVKSTVSILYDISTLFSGNGLSLVVDQLEQVLASWGNINRNMSTGVLLDQNFWSEAGSALALRALNLTGLIIKEWGSLVLRHLGGRKRVNRFRWLLYMPTPHPDDWFVPNFGFTAPLPKIEILNRPVWLRFGEPPGSAHRGRLFGIGFIAPDSTGKMVERQVMRMDYHGKHPKGKHTKYLVGSHAGKYAFHWHILKKH